MKKYYPNLTGKWLEVYNQESNKDYFKAMFEVICEDELVHNIYPENKNWYKALELTPFENVKVVILGQDPYHEQGQAHGLAFSVPDGVKIPPSLRNIYREIENEYNVELSKNSGNFENWAKQGVLLLNAVLTVQEGNPNSHRGLGWELFTDRLIKELSNDDTPKVFLLWGSNARSKKKIIDNPAHLILESVHPSPLSANRGGWFGNNHFIKANEFLKKNSIKEINWLI